MGKTNGFRWPAPAKINLMLHILGRRADGYHLLETHFQFLEWFDWLTFEVTTDGQLTRSHEVAGVAVDQDLSLRAAAILRERSGISAGAIIGLEKTIPMGAGLGGGSSDAATVLVALNEIWGTGLSEDELADIGLGLGADVPVFVRGQAAFATGVGEHLTPLEATEGAILVIFPACHVETRAIFSHPELTRDTPSIKIPHLASTATRNDCEAVTRNLYPAVDEALNWLTQFGDARMSGTGASVFAVFDSAREAESVAQQTPSKWNDEWIIRVTNRINRSPLQQARAEFAANRNR